MPGYGESHGFNEEQLMATNVVDELKQVLYSLNILYCICIIC